MKRLFVILLVLCPYMSYGSLLAQIYSTSSSTFRSYSSANGVVPPTAIEFRSTSVYKKINQENNVQHYSTAPMQVANGSIKTMASSIKGGVLSSGDETGYIPPTSPQRVPGVPDTDAPIGDGWDVALLLALLCVGYVVRRYMAVKRVNG